MSASRPAQPGGQKAPATSGRPEDQPAAGPSRPEIAALTAALRAEQAAVYGYGVVGAHLTGAALTTATADWTAHQMAEDKLAGLLRAHGDVPPPAAVAYQLPRRVDTAAQAAGLAAAVEDEVTAAYLGLVALTAPALRMLGARQARAAAVRAAGWRGRTIAFPGLPASALAGPG